MRSRYTAYALRDSGYLRRTWHPDTYPLDLDLEGEDTRYTGLTVQRAHGNEVEFTATLKVSGRAHRLRERSTFARVDGAWVYLDGVTPP